MLFITGITGHTGKWFFERLVKEKYRGKVKCLIRSFPPSWDVGELDVEWINGDLNDFELLVNSMCEVDCVVHIASINHTPNIIKAAIKNKVKRAIFVHTTGRFSKYKSASQRYIEIEDASIRERDKIDVTIVRPTMIYGSSMDRNMIKLIKFLYKNKFFPMFGNGENLMQPVHARDLGNAYYDILINPEITKNKEYDLSGKEPLSYIELVRTVSRVLQRKSVIIKIPFKLSLLSMKIYNVISKKPKITVEQVLRMQEDKAFSYELAKMDFGYDPISFEEGIKEEVGEYLVN